MRVKARRGGFTISADGLRNSDEDDTPTTPWSEVTNVEADEHGILISTDSGRYFKASVDAENYLSVMAWLVAQQLE